MPKSAGKIHEIRLQRIADRELADAIRYAPNVWLGFCNDCNEGDRFRTEADVAAWLTQHEGHEAGKVASL